MRRHLEPWFATEVFAFADDAQKEAARSSFLARLKSSAARRAFGCVSCGERRPRAFYLLSLRPGTDLAQLLPNVSPLQRELDVVLLHEGILEPALGITPQSVHQGSESHLRTRSGNALAAVDSGKAQISFLLNACDVEEVVKIATAKRSHAAKIHPTFPQAPQWNHDVSRLAPPKMQKGAEARLLEKTKSKNFLTINPNFQAEA